MHLPPVDLPPVASLPSSNTMNTQVLTHLAELRLHIDKRLDEIFSMVKEHSGSTEFANSIGSNDGDKRAAQVTQEKVSQVNGVPQQFIWPSVQPSVQPSMQPTVQPSVQPFVQPSVQPQVQPPVPAPEKPITNGYAEPTPQLPTASDDGSLKYLTPEFGKFLDVSLSYVYSSRAFFLHLNYGEVENFYLSFNEYYMNMSNKSDITLSSSSISHMQLCCILDVEDSSYYRAQVLKESEGKFLVRLVDFGDMKLVSAKSIFKLFPEYAKVPVFSLHCYLDDKWTSDFAGLETAFMDFLSQDNPYCVQVKAKFNPKSSQFLNKMPVSLQIKTTDGDVKDLRECLYDHIPPTESVKKYTFNYKEFSSNFLVPSNFENLDEVNRKFSSIYPTKLSTSELYVAICTHVADISSFSVALASAIEFTTNLSYFYRGYLEYLSTDLKVNSLVVFGIENKFFFRGFVLSADSPAQIFAIDLGFVITVKDNDVYPLFDIFSLEKFQPQTILCTLNKISPILESWSPVAIKTFQTFVQGKFNLYAQSFSNGLYHVEVEMGNKNRATDMLKKFRLGKEDLF